MTQCMKYLGNASLYANVCVACFWKGSVGNKQLPNRFFFFSNARRFGGLLYAGICSRRARRASCAYRWTRYPWPCDCQHTFVEASVDVWLLWKKSSQFIAKWQGECGSVRGGLRMKMQWKPYLEIVWNPNGTTESSKTQLLYRDSQLRPLNTILRRIMRWSLRPLRCVVSWSSFTQDDKMSI